MSKSKLKNRKAKRKYLSTWLENFGKAQELTPKIQMEIEKTDWEIEVLKNIPNESVEIPTGDLGIYLENDYKYLTHVLPMIPPFDIDAFSSSSAMGATGTADIYRFVSRVGDLGTQEAIEFSNLYTSKYQEIQVEHNRSIDICLLLVKLQNQGTLDRFNRAETSYLMFKAGKYERTAAAMEMRTFLNGLQGDLFQRARKQAKENMTWEKMAEKLSKGGISSLEYNELVRQGNTRSSLISRLSDVGKNREGSSVTNLNHIWSELLDHVYTVLNIINL